MIEQFREWRARRRREREDRRYDAALRVVRGRDPARPDPLDLHPTINEFLADPWVGADAMRSRPMKRRP